MKKYVVAVPLQLNGAQYANSNPFDVFVNDVSIINGETEIRVNIRAEVSGEVYQSDLGGLLWATLPDTDWPSETEFETAVVDALEAIDWIGEGKVTPTAA